MHFSSLNTTSAGFIPKNGVSHRIIHDPGLGSIRYIVNPSTRQVVQEIEYDEYGNMMKNSNPEFQPLTFAGGLWDAETKLYRFGARDYDPTIGRWTTKDPSGFNGGTTNLYEYGFSNPMSYIDPDGLSPRDVTNIKNAFNTIVNQMIKNGQRRDGKGYLNGQLNNAESLLAGLSYMTNGKMVGRLFEGCEGQSSITQNQLQSLKTDDQWSFQLIFDRNPLHPMGHFRIQGTSSNPSDPKLILDPWAFEFSE